MDYIVGAFLCYVGLCVLTAQYGGAESLGQFFSLFHATSPVDAERRRAGGGLGFLTIAALIVYEATAKLGGGFYWRASWTTTVAAIAALRHGTAGTLPEIVWEFAGAAALVGVLIVAGMFRLLVGWHRSRGPRDMVAAAKALFSVVLSTTLLIGSHYGARWAFLHYDWSIIPTVNAFLPAFYVWLLVKALARLYLTLRGAGAGNARKLVDKEIRQTAIAWRPARRTQF
jgi:hypothetical protein